MQTLVLAWRNIWRNPRRTLITASAIGLGLTALLVWVGIAEGLKEHLVRAATSSQLGAAQIHSTRYRDTGDADAVIPNGDAVFARALETNGIGVGTTRVYGTGLVSIGDRSAGIQVIGIDADNEPKITDWHDHFVGDESAYLSGHGQVLLGKKLASKLEVDVGSKLVLTAADVTSGDMRHALLKVSGVIFTNNTEIDSTSVIVTQEQAAELLGVEGFHEIVLGMEPWVNMRDADSLEELLAPLETEGLTIESWLELVPVLNQLLKLQAFFLGLSVLITFAVVGLGIVNTLSMSVLERTHEFGILRAIGTSGGRLASLIFAEAASLGTVGAVLGILLWLPVHIYLTIAGLPLGGADIAGVTLDVVVYSVLNPAAVSALPPVFIVMTTVTALTTAIRTTRIQPVEALRHF